MLEANTEQDLNSLLDSLSLDELEDIYARYAGYEAQPVDIETFIRDPYFLGSYFADADGRVSFYSYWYDVLKEIYPSPFLSPYWLIGLRGSIGRGKCCHEDTLIPTNIGIITIKEIYERYHRGEEILVMSEKGINKVIGAINSGVMRGIRYYTSDGSHGIVGLDHKFKCINGRGFLYWKPAHQLRPGDKVVTINKEHPSPPAQECHSLETVDQYVNGLTTREHLPEEILRGDINLKRCFIRRAFDRFELFRGPGVSITFDHEPASWEFFMVIVSVGVRAFIEENTVVVLNGDIDCILKGCSEGSHYTHGPDYLNKFLQRCNGDMVSVTFTEETSAQMYDISVEGSPTYSIGGLVTHNTMAACTGMAYDLYLLQCMKSPQTHFGLLQKDKIIFAIMNVTLALTKDVVWERLSGMFSASPYFTMLLDNARALSKMKSRIIKDQTASTMPKNIDFFSGSRITHTLGKAILHCVFSEANFEVMDNQVYRGFNSVVARQESRFLGEDGKVAGKVWIDSSEGDKFSTINRIMDKYKGQAGVYVDSGPLWYIRPWNYQGSFFCVYTGSDMRKPDIIDYGDASFQTEPERVMVVPEEHRGRFEADLEQALRDLGGVATISSYLLFRNKMKLVSSLLMSPLFPDVFSLDFEDPSDQIHMRCQSPVYFKINRHHSLPRHIHIDIALSGDRLGIASSCITGFKETEVMTDVVTMQTYKDSVPTTLTDFAFGIEAKQGQQIPLYKIRQFIMWLKSNGMHIGKVTADGFQSADMLQLLKLAGIETETLSVDKTPDPYIQLRNSVNEGRSILPNNAVLRKEAEHLEVAPDGKKVDHPEEFSDGTKGSKDIADGVCGSISSAIADSAKYRLLFTNWPEERETHSKALAAQFWPGSQE